jgi:hypothetical protein
MEHAAPEAAVGESGKEPLDRVEPTVPSSTFRAANSVVVPLRMESCVIVPARPFFIGRLGCVRSRAWICDFSSTERTTAWAGGST